MAFIEITDDIKLDSSPIDIPNDTLQTKPSYIEVGEDIKLDNDVGSFVGNVSKDFKERVGKTKEFIGKTDITPKNLPVIGAITFGQAAGVVNDIIAESLASGYKSMVPDEAQKYIKNKLIDFSQTKPGKLGIEALQNGAEAYDSFAKKMPDAALALDSMLNVFGLSTGRKVAKLTAKEIVNMGDDVVTLAEKASIRPTEAMTSKIVQDKLEKAIRPGVAQAKTSPEYKNYFRKADEAVRTIIDEKDILSLTDDSGNMVSGSLPKNLKQFGEAISTVKKNIFKRYDDIATASGDKGAIVNLDNVVKELSVIANDRGMTRDIRKYAKDQIEEFSELGQFSPIEAQTRIQVLNNKLKSVSDFNSAEKAAVDSLVANNLRKNLDNAIENVTGEQYGVLKKKYGALSTIEKDVNKRAMVDARKNIKGLIDFSDIFTGAEVVSGIATMNPAAITKGIIGKTISSSYKAMNDPNRMIKNMFESVENTIEKSEKLKGEFKPKSFLRNWVPIDSDVSVQP